jgi:hypothetical protein
MRILGGLVHGFMDADSILFYQEGEDHDDDDDDVKLVIQYLPVV